MPQLTGDRESTYRTFRMFSTFYAKEKNRNNSLEGVQKNKEDIYNFYYSFHLLFIHLRMSVGLA